MHSLILGIITALLLGAPAPALAVDTDGDGLPDAIEESLGTDPRFPEALSVVHESAPRTDAERAREGYDPTKDVLKVEFGHVAEDRFLWRTTFAAPPNLEDTVHHIYVDADADTDTGREGYGVEYMLTVAGGRPTSQFYTPTGERGSGPVVRFVVHENTLLTCADVDLGRDEEGAAFRMWVLCHTTTSEERPRPPMTSSTPRFMVQGIALNDREKIMQPGDHTSHYRVRGTFGLDVLRPLLVDERNGVVGYDELEIDGFEVDLFTQRRYGHLRALRHGARASHTVRTPGRYFVGFVMYDDGRDQRVVIRLNDEVAGVAVLNTGNRRHWICHLEEPRDLRAGDVISMEAAGSATGAGNHGLAHVLLLAEPPEMREIQYRVENTNWIAPVNSEGEAWVSWTTTWPSSSRFEYGRTTDYGEVATEDCNRLVHRARLTGLEPGVTYRGRGVGIAPDGSEYHGPDITFNAHGIAPPPTREGVTQVPLVVRNWHHVDAVQWPVTSGVPFPQGALATEKHLRLLRGGEEVLAQFRPLGTWPDGSIKWVLVSILADVPAGETAEYALEFGREVSNIADSAPQAAMAAEQGGEVVIDTGGVRLRVDAHGQLVGPEGPHVTELVDGEGKTFTSALADAQLTIEDNGPIRAVVKSVADLTAEDGSESFRVEQRVEAWRGQPFVRVQHTFTNTLPDGVSRTTLQTTQAAQFADIERISLVVPGRAASWRAPIVEGEPLTLRPGGSVWQRFDDEFAPAGAEPVKGRIIGGLIADDDALAVSVRDLWRNYPKGFSIREDAAVVDLAPAFEPGLYDEFPFEKEGHHLYFYLRDGTYTLKRGMAKTHELLLDFGPGAAARAEVFQRPLLLTAEPEWYTGTKVFYNVAPRDEERFAAYEEAVDRNVQNYLAARERQRDYGMMNYGDWYGERGVNWGNIEYDTQFALFLEYIRSGNPDAFFLGEAAQVHNRDVDTVQWSPSGREEGLVYVHQMGHVGGYYDQAVPDTLGIPRAGGSISHAWTEGHFAHYFLTGDMRSLETGMLVVDYFTNAELSRPYDWVSARQPGWHLIMLASALATTNDPYYLNASRIVIDRVLEAQDTEPRELPEYQKEPGRTHQLGGWTRMMVPGHCLCEPRHRGNANFMIAVLLAGMGYYYDVTQEPEVRDSIILGAHFMMDDFYSTETHGFRYTSCPNMRYGAGVSPVYMVEGIARAYGWTRDEEFLDALTNGLALGARGSGYGKGFSAHYRSAPRVLADLAAVGLGLEEGRRPALAPFEMPGWLAQLEEDRRVVLQAEDFSDQGGGQVEIRDDRQATWGTMITRWHSDIGHWLEWSFEVPRDGNYRVVFRYATSSEDTRRKFEINGEVPHEAAEEVAFPSSGGFGGSVQDWAYLPLKDAEGNDVALRLPAGKHTLRMTNLGDGLGMDFIVLVRED